jgi:hypothetical protein
MFRKIVVGLGIVVVLFIAWVLVYFFYITRLASPEAEVHYENSAFSVDIGYCRPGKKDRLIFGTEKDGALVPYGKYWRLGANQATEIEFSSDVIFGGSPLKAGRYRMYAIPGAEKWKIRLNTETGEWGAMEPNYELDILEIEVDVQSTPVQELFTISVSGTDSTASIQMHWDTTLVEIPVQKN